MADIQLQCRLCLQNSIENTIDLFRHGQGLRFAAKILDMMSIEVIAHPRVIDSLNNALPTYLQILDTPHWPRKCCFNCVRFLLQMQQFKKDILSVQQQWQSTSSCSQPVCRLCRQRPGVTNLFRSSYAQLMRQVLNVKVMAF